MYEKQLQERLEHPDFLVEYGSRLYGTHTETSDTDYRGFVFPPIAYSMRNPFLNFEQSEAPFNGSPDTVIWSFEKFVGNLMKGDPQGIEMLHTPEHQIVNATPLARLLITNRQLFISRRLHNRVLGYSTAEWRKVKGVHQTIEKISPDEDATLEAIRHVFKPPNDEMNEVRRILFSNHARAEKSSTRHLGQKRKAQIAEFGYCVKSASHSLRLLGELQELHETGTISFPRADAKLLLDVKLGKMPFEECEKIYNDRFAQMKAKEFNSALPHDCDRKKIYALYWEIVANAYPVLPRI